MEEAQKDVVVLETSLQRELEWANRNEAKNFTIFRTPHNISESKKKHFEPSVISIGPFHHGKKHLRTLEEQKRRSLQDFLSRRNDIKLDRCISEMKSLETKARMCYSESFDDLDSNAFVQMMLLDGCFVFEYFSRYLEQKSTSIDEVGWNFYFINRDLLLLENQIPFFIVEKLYKIGLNGDRMMFVKLIARVFLCQVLTQETIDSICNSPAAIPDPDEIHHLVHLCYHYVVPNPEKPNVLSSNRIIKGLLHRFCSKVPEIPSKDASPNSTGKLSLVVIPSATELKEAGLKFRPKSNPKDMLNISFEYGVLKIPRLQIINDTKPIFANLLAFEHSKYGKEHFPFTSFVAFLDYLVNTPNDVRILQQAGIVESSLSSEEEFAQFINEVTDGCEISKKHYLAELYMEVNRYVSSSWHRQRAKLVRDYFSSPWAAISLVAALILLVLTSVQSFYAVYAYKFPPSS